MRFSPSLSVYVCIVRYSTHCCEGVGMLMQSWLAQCMPQLTVEKLRTTMQLSQWCKGTSADLNTQHEPESSLTPPVTLRLWAVVLNAIPLT